jgi:hypothetical protein
VVTLRLEVEAPDRACAARLANRLSVELAERYGVAALTGEIEPATRDEWSTSGARARRAPRRGRRQSPLR